MTTCQVGQRFGRWTVTGDAGRLKGRPRWECRCECGTERQVEVRFMLNGRSTSCGCAAVDGMRASRTTHGASQRGERAREYRSWKGMKTRCFNANAPQYPHYGGRGITIDLAWADSFEAFFRDMGPCPDGLTLERNDTNGNYGPGNCRWATHADQSRNRRMNRNLSYGGDTMTLTEWARRCGITHSTLAYRLDQGWPLERALQPATK